MKKQVKIWFSDFYDGFDPSDNFLVQLLSDSYEVILNAEQPDYLFFSCYGQNFLKYSNCVRIYYTGENVVPDFNLCDYAIGFHYLDFRDRYLRYPNFAMLHDQFENLIKPTIYSKSHLNDKEFFCNFIYANSKADPIRDYFFHLLGSYKLVSSPGRHLNNTNMDAGERYSTDWMYTKLSFQSKCKFSITFENSSSPGYTTEKLMHAFLSNTIPIYWGDPEVTKDFNSRSFINCHEFNNFEEVVERIKEIDQANDLYLSILNEPSFKNNAIPQNLKKETLLNFLKNIFDKDYKITRRRALFGTTPDYENHLYTLVQLKNDYSRIEKLRNILKNPNQIFRSKN